MLSSPSEGRAEALIDATFIVVGVCQPACIRRGEGFEPSMEEKDYSVATSGHHLASERSPPCGGVAGCEEDLWYPFVMGPDFLRSPITYQGWPLHLTYTPQAIWMC